MKGNTLNQTETQADNIQALTAQLTSDALATWSDDKRKLFTDTFDARIRTARYILIKTAAHVAYKGKEKHFISDKHLNALPKYWNHTGDELNDKNTTGSYHSNHTIGGRPTPELDLIAVDRAMEIINTLPQLNEAVRIISPEVSAMIEKRSKLLAKGKLLLTEAESLAGHLDMEDFDQNMTIAAFRASIKDREKKRTSLLNKLDDIGAEGGQLDSRINKFLYNGLPGLSEAVIKVISDYVDRAAAFSGLNRRVAEQVQFGDSDAALELLKGFEQDEVKVSTDVKAQFDAALEVLKLAGKKKLGTGSKQKLLTRKA
jgi:hypothetical protein